MNKERNYAWYTYNGVEGILAEKEYEKFKGIEPYEEGDDYDFYTFESLKDVEILEEDTHLVLSDSYGIGCTDKGGEIKNDYVTNPENEQKMFRAWEYTDIIEDDKAVRELNTYTDRYYNWTSELTRYTDSAIENNETKEELEKKWKEISSGYKFHFSEPLDFKKIWETIEYYRDLRK